MFPILPSFRRIRENFPSHIRVSQNLTLYNAFAERKKFGQILMRNLHNCGHGKSANACWISIYGLCLKNVHVRAFAYLCVRRICARYYPE